MSIEHPASASTVNCHRNRGIYGPINWLSISLRFTGRNSLNDTRVCRVSTSALTSSTNRMVAQWLSTNFTLYSDLYRYATIFDRNIPPARHEYFSVFSECRHAFFIAQPKLDRTPSIWTNLPILS